MHSYNKFTSLLLAAILIVISAPCLIATDATAIWGKGISPAESPALAFRPAGFLQQQFTYNTEDDEPMAFSIYRARFGFAGSITDRISMNVILGAVEPPDSKPHLVNAFVDFAVDPRLKIRTGQFLVPFGLEGPEVIIFNPAIERTLAIRRLNTVNMFRDVGIQASGSMNLFNYAIAVINGTGANNSAQFNPKDVLGRIGVAPIENLDLGVSGHLGRAELIAGSGVNNRIYRLGTDFQYQFKPVLVRGEFIFREDDLSGHPFILLQYDSIRKYGGYLLGTYTFFEKWQTLLRYEFYDANTSADDDHMTAWTAGINYYFTGQSRISANYELRNDRNNTGLGDLFTVQLQIAL